MDGQMSSLKWASRPVVLMRQGATLLMVLVGASASFAGIEVAEANSEAGSETASTAHFAEITEHLLQALEASNEHDRKGPLRAAQAILDTSNTQPNVAIGDRNTSTVSQFKEELEASIDHSEGLVKKRSYQNLMSLIWESPYATWPDDDLGALEKVSDALEILNTLSDIDPENRPGLEALQSAYWGRLETRRRDDGLEISAISESAHEPVFDQRVDPTDSGRPEIYQLIGTSDKRVKWKKVQAETVQTQLNLTGPLSVNLDDVRAPWVVVISASRIDRYVNEHTTWLDGIREQAVIILIEQSNFVDSTRNLPAEMFNSDKGQVYLLPGPSSAASESLTLISTSDREIVARWPASHLSHERAESFKTLVNDITSISVTR